MKSLAIGGALALALVAAPAIAATSAIPPMNSFDEAFYSCDNGGAFAMSYDSDKPTTATMTTSNDNAQHVLKKAAVANGVEFSSGGVKFWTDGQSVVVDGTQTPFRDCKLKSN